ncbi:bifunctional metallophosphatase/5'-nucleotidase [Dehalobacter sp. DCM]|uniref:bifunctional metallophosphatase/5'-nucleotidase n=1 Tax=Dehalobacter sp. DCM TaxID=2907827 RepID=UPI0030817FF9|nr:bifunctional metallophosphatase/5'-nucleotidase [Dehalobacter sp. DCM]
MRITLKTLVTAVLVCSLLLLSVNTPPVVAEGDTNPADSNSLTILFTNDLHDHLLPVKAEINHVVTESGGFARLQSAILAERAKDSNTLLVDGGDYSMGTPFQTIFRSDSPELKIMGMMGYDAVTFGNHEYDYRAAGLADSLTVAAAAAKENGSRLPQIVQANVTFPKDASGQLSPSLQALAQAYQEYGVKEYTIIEKKCTKIGIFGIMGIDSASNAPKSEVVFTDPIDNAQRIVKVLKEQEKVDVIVCLSHSGTWPDKAESEDEILAEKVPDINVIISAHTHTKLVEPIIVGKTIIGSVEDSAKYLGVLKLTKDSNANWALQSYRLQQINNSLPDDKTIAAVVAQYKQAVQSAFFDQFNLDQDAILAMSPYNFHKVNDILDHHHEDTLGNLISDSYIYAVKKAEGDAYIPVTMAVVPAGTIRSTFYQGNITAADAFSVSSLGIGPDNIPGYPLISIYLTGKELKTVCEVDASIAPMMKEAQLFLSGVNFTFNPHRMIFNKVTAVTLQTDGGLTEIDDTKLYRVIAGLYSAQMLSVVGDKSHGVLSLIPKTEAGTPITDFEAQIIKDTANGMEVKEWQAIAQYLQSFPKVNGTAQIPSEYSDAQGRKVIDDSTNIVSLVKNPNKITLAVFAVVIILAALICFIISRIVIHQRRKSKRIQNSN